MAAPIDSEAVRQEIRVGYGKIGENGGSSPVASRDLARHMDYSAECLPSLPEGAKGALRLANRTVQSNDHPTLLSTGRSPAVKETLPAKN